MRSYHEARRSHVRDEVARTHTRQYAWRGEVAALIGVGLLALARLGLRLGLSIASVSKPSVWLPGSIAIITPLLYFASAWVYFWIKAPRWLYETGQAKLDEVTARLSGYGQTTRPFIGDGLTVLHQVQGVSNNPLAPYELDIHIESALSLAGKKLRLCCDGAVFWSFSHCLVVFPSGGVHSVDREFFVPDEAGSMIASFCEEFGVPVTKLEMELVSATTIKLTRVEIMG